MSLRVENPRLLDGLEPFAVVTTGNRDRLDLRPLGLPVAPDAILDPLRRTAAPFLEMLARLDAATFGPGGMPMPRWAFLDVAELPGGIVGLGRRAAAVPAAARELLGVPAGYEGLVPLSMYIAMPTVEPGVWVGHNLSSLRAKLPGEGLEGLGGLTKAVALAALRARAQIGVTQWDSAALRIHTRMGPLALLSAWTPGHLTPHSLTYRIELDGGALRSLAGDPGARAARLPPMRWIDSSDHAAMRALQDRIEAGGRLCVAGPPEPIEPGRQRVPIASLL
ncbi:MAG: hypothetical protein IT372_28375 [Polyangiaceae bacterium]|nr:hypothetical protein [Polyangiaceae bacterium]